MSDHDVYVQEKAYEARTEPAWADVAGYEGLYKVSQRGEVLSCERVMRYVREQREVVRRVPARILKYQFEGRGACRGRVSLCDGESRAKVYVCDLVEACFGQEVVKALPDILRKACRRRR